MYSQQVPQKWIPQIERTRDKLEFHRRKQQKEERTSILKPFLRSYCSDEAKPDTAHSAFKRRYRRTQVAGIFAHAKSSRNYSSFERKLNEYEDEELNEDPRDYPNRSNEIDIGRSSHEPNFLLKRQPSKNLSRYHHLEESSEDEKEEIQLPIHQRHPALPSLRKHNSDAETDDSTKWEAVKWFSDRLDKMEDEFPQLLVNLKTNRKLCQLEMEILNAEILDTAHANGREIPIMSLIGESSEWLLYAEDYNDCSDHKPEDPHYLTEKISNRYDQFIAAQNRKSAQVYSNDDDDFNQECNNEATHTDKISNQNAIKTINKVAVPIEKVAVFDKFDCNSESYFLSSPEPNFEKSGQFLNSRKSENNSAINATTSKSSFSETKFPSYIAWRKSQELTSIGDRSSCTKIDPEFLKKQYKKSRSQGQTDQRKYADGGVTNTRKRTYVHSGASSFERKEREPYFFENRDDQFECQPSSSSTSVSREYNTSKFSFF